MADLNAHLGATAFRYEPLPPPPPDEISQDRHEDAWRDSIKAQAEEAGVLAVDAAPSPGLPVNSAEWREMMFRPGMASAMMFVLYEVVHNAATGGYDELDSLVDDLRAWLMLTIPEREALIDLFVWVERQVYAEDSVIPPSILANMARAYGGYGAHVPETGDIEQ